MKKIILVVLFALLLCGCSVTEQPDSKEYTFLTQAEWEGMDTSCTNHIRFSEDGSFNNWCSCGSPVGEGDIVEEFQYLDDTREIVLLDGEGETIETGKILYVDEAYLVVELWDALYTYENLNAYQMVPRESALAYTETDVITKPCLTILEYTNDMMTVSSMDYDGDVADCFTVWELPVSPDVVFSTVDMTIVNDEESIETSVLTEADFAYVGEYYTTGYFTFNPQGEVVSVVFYGELIIME